MKDTRMACRHMLRIAFQSIQFIKYAKTYFEQFLTVYFEACCSILAKVSAFDRMRYEYIICMVHLEDK